VIAAADLPGLLEWGDAAPEAGEAVAAQRLSFIATTLATHAERGALAASPRAEAGVATLSLAATERLLRSPAICQCLRTGDLTALPALVESEIILDQEPTKFVDGWSALGDVWLGRQSPPVSTELNVNPDGRPHSPSVAAIPIDLSLPPLPEFPRSDLDSADDLGCRIAPGLIEKLDKAVRKIDRASPPAGQVLRRMTDNLVLRTDRANPAFRSASSAAALGRVLLVNAEDAGITSGEIAEALVHEAIHAIVSCVELREPLLERPEAASAVRMESPWTGAALHPHAFIHACFVWFGLSNFWRQARDRGVATGFAERRLRAIGRGFARMNASAYRDTLPVGAGTFDLLCQFRERGAKP
jgi:hypothetical protein